MKNITSTANTRIKEIAKLKDAKGRKKQGLIIIEGSREIELALRAGWSIEELYVCTDYNVGYAAYLQHTKEVISVSKEVFAKIAYKENPEGLLAVAKPHFIKLAELEPSLAPLVIILENVEKPGNLGAILRTAYAAKVDAIIINDSQTDIFNPNVVRASMGHIFTVPTVVASIEETAAWLKENNITSYATAITAKNNYTQENYRGGTAIVMGTENSGLSDEWLEASDKQIIIPMQAGIDSLNVSVSTALVVYEALRQREFPNETCC